MKGTRTFVAVLTISGFLGDALAQEESQHEAAVDNPLMGSDWQLVEIQSMDDSIGTVRPKDPSLFTMRLHGDGTVSMHLDCNRATGRWSAEPGPDGHSGRFEFGPLAATRALCAPPNLDERIAAQAEYIRSYLLKDGRLFLSLMADGGIWAWDPAQRQVTFESEPDARIEAAVLAASPDYSQEIVDISGRKARYAYSRVDLDGDGKKEVFVLLMGSIFCGTGGCDLLLLTDAEGGYRLVNNFPISRAPVVVSEETTAGWKNLVRLESGGGAEPSYVIHAFDGEKYVERERVPADDDEPEGTRVLAGDYTFADGIPLEPRS